MAFEKLLNGSTSLANAAWLLADDSAGSGWADDATLAIVSGSQTITSDLDDGSSLTTGIDWFHIHSGFQGKIGTAASPLNIKFDTSWTSDTNPSFQMAGGVVFLDCANACPRVRVLGGTLYHVDGTITNLEVLGGEVRSLSTSTVWTNVYQMGGLLMDELDNANDITSGNYYGGVAYIRRQHTAATMKALAADGRIISSPTLYVDHNDGTTTLNQDGGTYWAIRGAVPTINGFSGAFRLSAAKQPVAIAGSAATVYPAWNYEVQEQGSAHTIGTLTRKLGPAIVNVQATAPSFPA